MTTKQLIAGLVLTAVAPTVSLRAQVPVNPSAAASPYLDRQNGLTLDAAVARALEREPSLRAERANIEIARGLRQQAGLRPNPTWSFERRTEPAGTDNQTSAGVTWPLDLFRRGARIDAAERELAATEFAVADRVRRLAAGVRVKYGVAAAGVRDVQVTEDLAATTRRQLELVRARVDAGATPPLEASLLEVELRRFEAERILAGGRADAALVELRPLLGMPPDEPLMLGETLEGLVTGRPTATAPSIAMRPDVQEAEARVIAAEARTDLARREGRVDISLFGTYMRMDAGFPQQGFNAVGARERVRGRFTYVAAGAMVMLPLFNRNQGQVAVAQAERSAAEARRDAAVLGARAEVAAARARDGQARRAVTVYTDGMRTLARHNLDVVSQTFDLGRLTVFDVLTEQRRYLEIEQAYTNALREAWEARTALELALGEIK